MKRTLKLLLNTLFLIIFSKTSFGQFPGCPTVDAGTDVNLDCSTPCTNLTAAPFNVGATTSYTVQSIPHNPPISYSQAGGTSVSVGTDDVWSPAISLPFDFCFYGQTYNSCVIGSNGAISFGTANALGYHPWSFTASCPSTALVNAGNIFGIYHDIDPSVAGTVKWYLLGTAPCRIFVVVFNNLAHFSCTSLTSTHMMVLYETTNAIDVYVDHKETCGSWNSGNAVIGIQNNAGTAGVTPPGRNTGAWTISSPEAWRFLPSGSPIYTVEWLEGSNVIATGNTVNVCPSVPTTYTARATYTSCNGQIIVEEDDVLVTPTPGGITVAETANVPASCGQSNGSLTATASGGTPGYTYSLDNVTYQSSGTFSNLAVGDYNVFAMDGSGCVGVVQISVIENTTLTMDFSNVQHVSCFGANDAEVALTALNGQTPYQFSANGGTPVATSTFTGLTPGLNTFTVVDAAGCTITIDTLITEPEELILTMVSVTDASCSVNDGGIEVTAQGGVLPYTYQINGASNQPTGVYTGLTSGTYAMNVIDDNGCQNSINLTVNSPATPVLTLVQSDPVCLGATNSNLIVSASGGTSPYTYDVDGSNPQSTPVFTTLAPGSYTINVTDNNGCVGQLAVEVDTIPLPEIFNDTMICGFDYWVNGTQAFNGGTWSSADTAIHFMPDANTLNPQILTSTQGVYTIEFTDAACNQTVSAVIDFPPYVYTEVIDTVVCIGSTYTIFAQQNAETMDFIWNTGQTGPSITINEEGNYIVTASNECYSYSDTATIGNKVCTITAPNVIVLSSTVGNNTFFVNYDGVKDFNCSIINRWGNLIYEYSDPNGKWDGTSNGKTVDEGVYFYIIKAVFESGEEVKLHGFVQVIY